MVDSTSDVSTWRVAKQSPVCRFSAGRSKTTTSSKSQRMPFLRRIARSGLRLSWLTPSFVLAIPLLQPPVQCSTPSVVWPKKNHLVLSLGELHTPPHVVRLKVARPHRVPQPFVCNVLVPSGSAREFFAQLPSRTDLEISKIGGIFSSNQGPA